MLGLSSSSRFRRLLTRPLRSELWLQPAMLGAALLGLILGLHTSHHANAQPPEVSVVETLPSKDVADRLVAVSKAWKLQACDEQPSVQVEGYRGFRIVLRRSWKHYANLSQQVTQPRPAELEDPGEARHEDWEFVLIPLLPKRARAELKTKIPWQESNSPYHTRDVCLGEGLGYVWYTRGTLYGQEEVRTKLKLDGGDDRLQLAMDGLLVKDEGTNTGNSCLHIPAKFGDRALPYVERTIAQARPGDELWRVVGCLAFIHTERSTKLLLKLFDSPVNDIQHAAQYALIHKPFRPAAKRAYLDMLRRQISIEAACPACAEFQWKEAVPILRDVIASPRYLTYIRHAIPVRRSLENLPIAQELLDAEQTLLKSTSKDPSPELRQQLDAARRLLIQTEDAEAANMIAVLLAVKVFKGDGTPVREAGLEILRSRPRQSTVVFLKSLAAGIHEDERSKVEKVLQALEKAEGTSGQQ